MKSKTTLILITILALLFVFDKSFAQTGSLQTDGVLVPKMTDAQRVVLSPVTAGQMVFSTTSSTFWYFNGSVWKQISGSAVSQNIDQFNLSGTTLNLSISDDGEAPKTVNLSSIDTDDQTIDVFNLSGSTLNLSLSNDGQATKTVDLSSLAGGRSGETYVDIRGYASSPGQIYYGTILGAGTFTSIESSEIPIYKAGTFSNLYIMLDKVMNVGSQAEVRLYKNGAPTSLVVTFSSSDGAKTIKEDDVHAVSVVKGDRITFGTGEIGGSVATGNVRLSGFVKFQ